MGKSRYLPSVIAGITKDFSDILGIEPEQVHTTWEFYNPKHYVKGNKTSSIQPRYDFPLIVDLLTPSFNSAETNKLMLETLAESIAKRAEFPKNNIFINHRQAQSGMVFDEGKVVSW